MIEYKGCDGVKSAAPRTSERGWWKPLRKAGGRAAPEPPVMSGTGRPRYRTNECPCQREIRVVPWSFCPTPEPGRGFFIAKEG